MEETWAVAPEQPQVAAPPEEETWMDATSYEAQQVQTSPLYNKHQQRVQQVADAMQKYEQNKINSGQMALRTMGGAAGFTMDAIGLAIDKAVKTVAELVPTEVGDMAKEGLDYLVHTKAGQMGLEALQKGWDAWNSFSEDYPEQARDIESIVNVAAVLAPAPKVPYAGATPLKPVQEGLTKWAGRQDRDVKRPFVVDLMTPMTPNKAEIADIAKDTTQQGLLRTNVYKPSGRTGNVVQYLADEVDVSPSYSYQKNFDNIQKTHKKLYTLVDERTKRIPTHISPQYTVDSLTNAVNTWKASNPLLTENYKLIDDYLLKAVEELDKFPKTPNGILNARKSFDKLVETQKGSAALGGEKVTAVSEAARTIRNEMNKLIEEFVPGTKELLTKDSYTYDAMKAVAPKAVSEGKTAISRTWNNLSKLGAWKSDLNRQVAVALGVSSFGAASLLGQGLVVAGLAGGASMLTHKIVTSPDTKKLLAKMVQATDQGIKTATNPNMIMQLRADRAILMEMLKQPTEKPEEQQ